MEKQKYEDIRGDGRLMLWQRGGADQNYSVRTRKTTTQTSSDKGEKSYPF